MNPQTKFAAAMGAGFIAFILLLYIGGSLMNAVQDQPNIVSDGTDAELVGDQMWDQRNIDMLVLSVMMFAGVIGVLALVGGEFKWR
ncbi:MAG: hypothetical protein KAJ33_03715 [Thermoplasmata archaeon]|nr:hypothetical protein [Thermoplasmata archaeon]